VVQVLVVVVHRPLLFLRVSVEKDSSWIKSCPITYGLELFILTSTTVATVGLGLFIPLAFVSDWILLPWSQRNNSTIISTTSGMKELVF
jgi:hypothetical protein